MTSGQYITQIENALLAQLRKATSSKEEATEFIDSLGFRDLLVPVKTQPSKKAAAKRVAPKKKIAAK
ncbi:hypothetical protein [Chitinophaga japonensis]|uniref:hypothetical protein n=1 Tax=Chitinophaga japonensis TaxID=104662 RepID=UPI0011A18476|nr:hypothetical protein [Chitinophaga japonensis]